jgi:aminoglycoside/choline kinase family phosphotransferase
VPPSDPRAELSRDWALRELRLSDAEFVPASADASFRRYFRVRDGVRSWIVMDAPPEKENCEPFIRIGRMMGDAGLNVPRLIAQDQSQGLLLLSDLGTQTYLNVIGAHNAEALFADAIDALLLWQKASAPGLLPEYDAALLQRELDLFPDWYLARHLQREMNADQREAWRDSCHLLVQSALAQPRVYVHRDYMPRNLMVSTPNPGVLDFQDAVYGPISYDVVCLFKDAFLSWPEERVEAWRRLYAESARSIGLPVADDAEFRRAFDWMGVQRHLKVLGIFARIRYRDGKPHYLEDAPRFIRYVREVADRYAELQGLLRLFDAWGMQA